jgi:hypothetical protein
MELRKNKKFMFPIDIKADGKRGMYGGAWCLAFVYTPKGNFLIRGYHREVKKYVSETFKNGFVNYSLWDNEYGKKRHRDIWEFINLQLSIFEPSRSRRGKSRHKWEIYDSRKREVVMRFKRMPKCWIPEFNNLIK